MTARDALDLAGELKLQFDNLVDHVCSDAFVHCTDIVEYLSCDVLLGSACGVAVRCGRLLDGSNKLCTDLDILCGIIDAQLLDDTNAMRLEVALERSKKARGQLFFERRLLVCWAGLAGVLIEYRAFSCVPSQRRG